MTTEEMMARIAELEQENKELRMNSGNNTRNVFSLVNKNKELAFVYPCYILGEWRTHVYNAPYGFDGVRNLALSVASRVDRNNRFVKPKVKNLSEDDRLIVASCIDELVLIMAKYKKEFLLKEGRADIVEAYGM